jgi:nucleotide-binding universal stress UspA family protein
MEVRARSPASRSRSAARWKLAGISIDGPLNAFRLLVDQYGHPSTHRLGICRRISQLSWKKYPRLFTITEDESLSPERIIENLRRHNSSVEGIWLNDVPTRSTGDALLTETQKLGADLLVAGVFGHPKLWEDVMGGVTRDLLSRMKVPTLMSY